MNAQFSLSPNNSSSTDTAGLQRKPMYATLYRNTNFAIVYFTITYDVFKVHGWKFNTIIVTYIPFPISNYTQITSIYTEFTFQILNPSWRGVNSHASVNHT